jgi:hypothetical protein
MLIEAEAFDFALLLAGTAHHPFVLDADDPAYRSSVFASYMIVNLGPSAVAQPSLGVRGEGFVLFCVVAIMICAASLPVGATGQPQPHIRVVPQVQSRRPLWLAPTALVTALLCGFTLGACWGQLPEYAAASGLGVREIGT